MSDVVTPTEDIEEFSSYKMGELLDASGNKVKVPSVTKEDQEPTVEDDFKTARDTLRGILGESGDVLTELKKLAKESDSPRAYEVLSNLIKTYADTSKDLLEIHEKKNKAKKSSGEDTSKAPPGVQNNQQNNIIFSGNEDQMFDLMEKLRGRTGETSANDSQ